MKRRKTILFFPVEPGIAHITRCLAIAQVLKNRGQRVIFAICREKQAFLKQAGMEAVPVSIFLHEDLWKWITTLKNPRHHLPLVQEELEILAKYKPDLVVVDFRLTAIVSAKIAGVPAVFVTHSGGLPTGCHIPNLGYPRFLHRFLLPFVQQTVRYAKAPFVNALVQAAWELGYTLTAEDILKYPTYLIPEAANYLPANQDTISRSYVGPIFWNGFTKYRPAWLKNIKPDGKTVYVTFGGTGYDSQKLIDLCRTLVMQGFRVIVSCSTIAEITAFPRHKRLYVAKYISGWDISQRVDIVVCHGGYGTMMQAALSGVPVVAMPFNPDQIVHSLRFQELGLGKTVLKISPFDLIRLDWTRLQELAGSIPSDRIKEAIIEILTDYPKYLRSIKQFKAGADFSAGSQKAAQVIERLTGIN